MGMGYIKLNHADKLEIHISGEMIIFVVLTAILLFLTLGAWAAFERKPRQETRDEKTTIV
jgi:hypothetical protein